MQNYQFQASGPGQLIVKPTRGEFYRDLDAFGKMDPYCIVLCGNQQQRTSSCMHGGKTPVWFENFIFNVNSEEILAIHVYDEDPGKDDLIGSGEMSIAQIRKVGNYAPWIDVSKGGKLTGRVLLELKWEAKPGFGTGGMMPTYPQQTIPTTPYQQQTPTYPYGQQAPTTMPYMQQPPTMPYGQQYPTTTPYMQQPQLNPYGQQNPMYPQTNPMYPNQPYPTQQPGYGTMGGYPPTMGMQQPQPYGQPTSGMTIPVQGTIQFNPNPYGNKF
jgi:hypothetical protein